MATPVERTRRRQRWLNVVLLLLVAATVGAATLRLSPLVGAPVRILLKSAAIALPLVVLLLVLLRLRRR